MPWQTHSIQNHQIKQQTTMDQPHNKENAQEKTEPILQPSRKELWNCQTTNTTKKNVNEK
jgi:hypothetical protein